MNSRIPGVSHGRMMIRNVSTGEDSSAAISLGFAVERKSAFWPVPKWGIAIDTLFAVADAIATMCDYFATFRFGCDTLDLAGSFTGSTPSGSGIDAAAGQYGVCALGGVPMPIDDREMLLFFRGMLLAILLGSIFWIALAVGYK